MTSAIPVQLVTIDQLVTIEEIVTNLWLIVSYSISRIKFASFINPVGL